MFLFCKIFLRTPFTIPVTTLFKIASSTSFVVFSSASTLSSSEPVLGPSTLHVCPSWSFCSLQNHFVASTMYSASSLLIRLTPTTSRLVNALRAAYTTFSQTRCGCPDAVPLDLRRRQMEVQSHRVNEHATSHQQKRATRTWVPMSCGIRESQHRPI